MFEFLEDNYLLEWWDRDFKAWYVQQSRACWLLAVLAAGGAGRWLGWLVLAVPAGGCASCARDAGALAHGRPLGMRRITPTPNTHHTHQPGPGPGPTGITAPTGR